MGRLTTDKKVEDMSMVELAHNCCYAKDKKARYRDYDIDIDAREFTRKLMCEKGYWEKDDAEMISDDIFDNSIMDNLMYEAKENTGLIALFYRNLWAMADLREKLKAYEDINDSPEKLKLIDALYLERCEEINRLKVELAEYKKLEENGLLLKMSVSEGSIVYLIDYTLDCKHNYECPLSYDKYKCEEDVRCQHEVKKYRVREALFNICMKNSIGKTVFLTRKEAEHALERMKEV